MAGVELHRSSVKIIKKQEMLAKINRNYSQKTTVQDLEEKIQVMKSGKIPYLVLFASSFLMMVVFEVN